MADKKTMADVFEEMNQAVVDQFEDWTMHGYPAAGDPMPDKKITPDKRMTEGSTDYATTPKALELLELTPAPRDLESAEWMEHLRNLVTPRLLPPGDEWAWQREDRTRQASPEGATEEE